MDYLVKNIDFDKYHTFFLEYCDFVRYPYNSHLIRPSTATYQEITSRSDTTVYTLEGAVMTFNRDYSLSQILLECSIAGISIDFIELLVPVENDKTSYVDTKVHKIIDLHKEDISKYVDIIAAPRFYVAIDRRKNARLKYLVIDRTQQDFDIKFLIGKYDKNAAVAGFKLQDDAIKMCKELNCNGEDKK